MLICNAGIWRQGLADLRIAGDRIVAIGRLDAAKGEEVLDAGGGAPTHPIQAKEII